MNFMMAQMSQVRVSQARKENLNKKAEEKAKEMTNEKAKVISSIDKSIDKTKLVVGSERVIKLLKNKKIKRITIAKDLKPEIKNKIIELAKKVNVEVVETSKTRKELGEELKKPFCIGCFGEKE